MNLLFTILPYPSSGTDFTYDSDPKPNGHDRSWALERAFNRNLNDSHCLDSDLTAKAPGLLDGYSMTLSKSVGYLLAKKANFPAFTFNTTAAETGDRFLLANYQVADKQEANGDVLNAESFLHTFGQPSGADTPEFHEGYADLPLATAARLSATFPFVSSASRLPTKFAKHSFHFVDGGYFDNDGTASVVEFLHSALLAKNAPQLRILLVEIHNGWDLDPANNADSFRNQDHIDGDGEHFRPHEPSSWGAEQQLAAPPQALWLAGHESVTRRNRRELCLLEKSYRDNHLLDLHHIVFDYENDDDQHQPLNWHLTPRQQRLIEEEGKGPRIGDKLGDARQWIKKVLIDP